MELPLTPLEFGRRARRLYAEREAVVDGDLRLTYREFFDRCDRWSAALQKLGVRPGDRGPSEGGAVEPRPKALAPRSTAACLAGGPVSARCSAPA